jgi:hypothetical protein
VTNATVPAPAAPAVDENFEYVFQPSPLAALAASQGVVGGEEAPQATPTASVAPQAVSGDVAGIAARDLDTEAKEAQAEVKGNAAKAISALEGHNDFLARSERLEAAAAALGMKLPKTILPKGHALYDSGVSALAADNKAIQEMIAKGQTADKALKIVTAYAEQEDRLDVERDLRTLRADADARLWRPGSAVKGVEAKPRKDGTVEGALGYTRHAWTQIVKQIAPAEAQSAAAGFAPALLGIDSDLRASQFNRWASKGDARRMTLRTRRTSNGVRVVRAALTERYADVTDLHLAQAVAGLDVDLTKWALDYKGDTGNGQSEIRLLAANPIPLKLFRVGDVIRVGTVIGNSETGQGSITVATFLERALCANLTRSTASSTATRIRHIGDAARVRAEVQGAIRLAIGGADTIVRAIVGAKQQVLGDVASDVFARIQALLKDEGYSATNTEVAGWKQTYDKSYGEYEPKGVSLFGVHSAMTEAAQGATWWHQTAATEEAAGALLFSETVRKALSA